MGSRLKFLWVPLVGIAALLVGADFGAPPDAYQQAGPAQDAYVLVAVP